jgi:hypothetical protein
MAKTYTTFGPLFRDIKAEMDNISDSARQVAISAGETGARMAENLTRTRPSPRSGKRGRVETGRMADSFKSEVVKDSPNEIVVEFGSLEDVQKYFVYQTETGFTFFDGTWVEPTYAMRDATEHAKELIEQWVQAGGKS